MWNLDDRSRYARVMQFTCPFAYTWGSQEKQKREDIRRVAGAAFPDKVPEAKAWAFRIFARKRGNKWDVENVPKLIVDAFSGDRLESDRSEYPQLRLYGDDVAAAVSMVQVAGEETAGAESTRVEVFAVI